MLTVDARWLITAAAAIRRVAGVSGQVVAHLAVVAPRAAEIEGTVMAELVSAAAPCASRGIAEAETASAELASLARRPIAAAALSARAAVCAVGIAGDASRSADAAEAQRRCLACIAGAAPIGTLRRVAPRAGAIETDVAGRASGTGHSAGTAGVIGHPRLARVAFAAAGAGGGITYACPVDATLP